MEDFGCGGIEHPPRHIGGGGLGSALLEDGQGGLGGQAAGDVARALDSHPIPQKSNAPQLLRGANTRFLRASPCVFPRQVLLCVFCLKRAYQKVSLGSDTYA